MNKSLAFLILGLIISCYYFGFEKETSSEEQKKHIPKMDAPEMHAIIERELRTPVDRDYPEYRPNQVMRELERARKLQATKRTKTLDFIERGPGNVAGRTRALVIDPRDATQNTWIAGAATGGIWKTTNGGQTWANKTTDLPNLGVSTMAIAPSNPDIIYAGSGESFASAIDGFGILKSVDAGESWTFLTDEADQTLIRNINRIIVDPANENVALAATENGNFESSKISGIYKTTDGGASWDLMFQSNFRIQDLDADPSNFNVQYAALNSSGVVKSVDGGNTWQNSGDALNPGGRIELAVSSVNPDRVWASVVGDLSGNESDLYLSEDQGNTWRLLDELNGDNEDFLGGQGFYDNIIVTHPFDQDVVYVGGVNLWKFTLEEGTTTQGTVTGIDLINTGTFLSFINFGGPFFGGAMELGSADEELFTSVEIRFGAGTQLAHRFVVGKKGPGVPPEGYFYMDYVEVPFQVWDIESNTQLMVSFRDQQEDGQWNLIEEFTGEDTTQHSREYLYLHGVPYSEEPDPTIAQDGSETTGQEYQHTYFIWPVLTQGGTFDPDNLPVSTMRINWGETVIGFKTTENISDAYGEFSFKNGFDQSERINEKGIHPDHHNLIPVIIDETAGLFKWIATNDGGVYISNPGLTPGEPDDDWNYAAVGYNTTQFYGADKAPGEARYIGGMQDNGTWLSASGQPAGPSSDYEFAISGDGFDVLWNNRDNRLIIGGSQHNNFVRSTDGGNTFNSQVTGISDVNPGKGPFRSRLSNNKSIPDRIFAVGISGVWRSPDFGETWDLTSIDNLWSLGNAMEVEVSVADPDIVWAGGALTDTDRLFYSIDAGDTFNPANTYSGVALGSISGLGTHPTDPNTAYALFSFAGRPKVLMTNDLGVSWTDISGFDNPLARGESIRGFPDVATSAILVLPNDPNTIWVGTEIGIVESNDAGNSWHLLNSTLPAVPVYGFKVQDSQVVVATHGRGIWTYDLPEKVIIPVAPSLVNAYIEPSGRFALQINYQNEFDSTQVLVNGVLIGSIGPNSIGSVFLSTENLGINEEAMVSVITYLNGQAFETPDQGSLLFETNDVESGYANNFDDLNTEDFIGDIGAFIVNGFPTNALHTRHDYELNREYIYVLKTPIVVQQVNSTFEYRDIAIVETGEEGAVFGEEDFFDYVVVEGTRDGNEWIPLADGYDASFDPVWDSLYTNDISGRAEHYISHSLNLHDTFNAGDTLLFRFRLFSDPGAVSWGWAIDDLVIQGDAIVTSIELSLNNSQLSVYPNPMRSGTNVAYDFPGSDQLRFDLIDLGGKVVRTYDLGKVSGKGTVHIKRDELKSGIYLLRITGGNSIQTKRLVIE